MSGGLAQLLAAGSDQSNVVVGSEASYWRTTWRRPTNFAIEPVRQDFTVEPKLGAQNSVVLSRQGDLAYRAVLELTVTKAAGGAYPACAASWFPAEALVKEVTLSLGGTLIDRHTGDWLRLYDSLHHDAEQARMYAHLTNFDPAALSSNAACTQTLYLPLCFSFCRHPSLALPMLALGTTETRLAFQFAAPEEVGLDPAGPFSAALYVDYVYLSNEERTLFSRHPLEYLIEQVQTLSSSLPAGVPSQDGVTTHNARLKLYRPVKSLYWVLADPDPPRGNARTHHARYFGDFDGTYLGLQPGGDSYDLVEPLSERLAPVLSASLLINGIQRLAPRRGAYYNRVVPFQYARRCPLPGTYMYSFGMDPGSVWPSGVCNFTSLENAELQLQLKQSVPAANASTEDTAAEITRLRELRVFAWGWNVLRVENGSAWLLM